MDKNEKDVKINKMDDRDDTILIWQDEEVKKVIAKHEVEIKAIMEQIKPILDDVSMVADTVRVIKKRKSFSTFFKYFSDKEYVIIGVVAIAVVAIFYVSDPTNIIMSIVSGLFGLGTGRYMGKDEE